MAAREGAEPDLNAQLNEAKQKLHELQEELGTAKLQNADLKAKNTDVRRRRTADRKQWTAEQQRGFQYQREICTLKAQLSPREREQRCGDAHYVYTSPRSTPTVVHVEGNDQELLQLENKKLRSRQSLLEDTMKENQALHEDRVQKAKQIGDLLKELECTAEIDPDKDHQIEELEQKVKKLKESANSDRNTIARFKEDSSKCATKISHLREDNQQKGTEVGSLTKQVEQQRIELEKHRMESEQQECRKRKLAAFLDSMGITKDDLGDDEPQTKKPTPSPEEPAPEASADTPATPAQVATSAEGSDQPSALVTAISPEQTASDDASPRSALAQTVGQAVQGVQRRPINTLNVSIKKPLVVTRLSLLTNGHETIAPSPTVPNETRRAPGTRWLNSAP